MKKRIELFDGERGCLDGNLVEIIAFLQTHLDLVPDAYKSEAEIDVDVTEYCAYVTIYYERDLTEDELIERERVDSEIKKRNFEKEEKEEKEYLRLKAKFEGGE